MKVFAKLPEALFLILIIATPVQLGKHFWPEFSKVLGIRIDFLSPTIFATDVVIFIFVVASFFRMLVTKKFPPKELNLTLAFLLVVFIVSSFFSTKLHLSFWVSLKFLEFASLAVAVSTLDISKFYSKICLFYGVCAIAVVILASLQFWQQNSVGLWILGERSFNTTTPGVAVVELQGVLILRPYATFPHPNVLAGFLAISFLLVLFSKIKKLVKFLVLPAIFYGIFLTFSRSSWLGLVLALIAGGSINLSWKKTAKTLIFVLVVFLLVSLIYPQNPVWSRFWQLGGSDIHSLILRTKLTEAALSMFFENPLLGVGPGNFLPNLPRFWNYEENIRFLQPVHNLPLLILAEIGTIGIFVFLLLFFVTFTKILKDFKKIPKAIIPVWVLIFTISGFDHYFWTLQQGQILFWTILGLTWAKYSQDNL